MAKGDRKGSIDSFIHFLKKCIVTNLSPRYLWTLAGRFYLASHLIRGT